MYEVALSNAKLAGDSSKARRVERGVKVSNQSRFLSAFGITHVCCCDTFSDVVFLRQTLRDLLKKAQLGRTINEDEIPPPVAIGGGASKPDTVTPRKFNGAR